MKINEVSSSSLSYIGDAVYTLFIRKLFVERNYNSPKALQNQTVKQVSAKGQMKMYNRLNELNVFNEEDILIFKRGRNAISHIPKNGDLISYQIASGFEAIIGYLYLTNKNKLDEIFKIIEKEI